MNDDPGTQSHLFLVAMKHLVVQVGAILEEDLSGIYLGELERQRNNPDIRRKAQALANWLDARLENFIALRAFTMKQLEENVKDLEEGTNWYIEMVASSKLINPDARKERMEHARTLLRTLPETRSTIQADIDRGLTSAVARTRDNLVRVEAFLKSLDGAGGANQKSGMLLRYGTFSSRKK